MSNKSFKPKRRKNGTDEEWRERNLKWLEEITTPSLSEEQQNWLNSKMPKDVEIKIKTNTETKTETRPAISGRVALLVQDASEAIKSKYKFLAIEETDELLYYRDGVYKQGGDKLIAKVLEAKYGYELNDHSLSQVIGHINRSTYHKREELDSDINIINLKNGLYHIQEDILTPHTPDHLSVKQKPITHNRDAVAKRFPSFLNEVLYEQNIQTAIDVLAYTFRRDYDIEIIVKLYGFGNNGKSVFTSLATALHGAENVSNVPLDQLIKNNFALSGLKDKDINIDNELGRHTISESAVLKRLTGGSRQPVRVEEKNKPAYDTTLYAKLIFNVNNMPDSVDKSDAYNRRVVILSSPYQFEGENEDKQLISKLTTEEEKSAIFNTLMDALRRIIETKEIRVNEKTIEERRAKYERAVNPWKSFYEKRYLSIHRKVM